MKTAWYIALLNPVNLLMLLAALLAGLLAAWWLFPFGVLLWIIMMITVMREPALQLNQRVERRAPLSQRFQIPFDRLAKMQISLFNTLSGLHPSLRRDLHPVQEAFDRLIDEVYQLCQRMTPLENYYAVSSLTESGLADEMKQLADKINATSDDRVKKEYEDAMLSLQQRASKLKEAKTTLERMDALMAGLANDLGAIMTDLIQLQAVSRQEVQRKIPALLETLQKESEQVRLFK